VEPSHDPYAAYTDEDLLTRIRSGQHDLFGPLVRRYEQELFGYLRRYVGDSDLAADVFQNTFVAVFRKIQHYEPGRSARPWVYTIATHQAIDALRRRTRRLDHRNDPAQCDDSDADARGTLDLVPGADVDPAEQAEKEEARAQVRDAVSALPELLKQVVLLTYFQGLKYQEAAEVLQVPVGTIKSRLHAALARLTAAWPESIQGAEEPRGKPS
jgi:RNA polymerase sigma-70 factor (ECF subfamily)